jgi:CRP-like cAMP-binding protein
MIQLLKDSNRSIAENKALIEYLSTLTEFTNLAKTGHEDYNELMAHLSLALKYEKLNINKIQFKTGERGNKFYIILRGKVAILIPKDEIVQLDEEEFMLYLMTLRKHEEHELLQNTLLANKHLFSIDSNESFDTWIVKQKEAHSRRYARFSTLFLNELENTIGLINGESNTKLSLSRKASKFKEDIDDYCTVEDYINRIKPTYFNKSYHERYRITIYQYFHVNSIGTGSKFGDLALIHPGKRRTATIIGLEETHLATLDKNTFEQCLRDLNERLTRMNLNTLVATPIFEGVTKNQFRKYYFNFFVSNKVARGVKLVVENEPSESVFFIKEGEFEIYFRRSLLDLNTLILSLGGKLELREEQDMMIDNEKFNKYMREKRNFRVRLCIKYRSAL